MRGLSVLELYMLVAVVRLQRRGGAGGASFECAFAEYTALQRLHRTADAYGRAAALRAFERLLGAALLEHPGGRYVTVGFHVGLGMTLKLALHSFTRLLGAALLKSRVLHIRMPPGSPPGA